ncbi:MAG: HIT family protein [Bacillota bacterium]
MSQSENPVLSTERAASNCVFCKIADRGEAVAYENEYFFVRFDKFPVSPGHSLIIPKRHVVSVFDLEADEWVAMKDALNKAKAIIELSDLSALYQAQLAQATDGKVAVYAQAMLASAFIGRPPDGYNVGNNDGIAASRTVHHLHIHVIPLRIGNFVFNARGQSIGREIKCSVGG